MTLESSIESFVEKRLPQNAEDWCRRYKKPRIIHDALWGTFRLEAHEAAVIDTDLFQRLRFIRQTGAVYLTYPSAHHTRFEHSLGVLYQSGRLCEALKSAPDEHRIDVGVTNDVRMAAIMHDTGHGPFSHSSEQFFEAMPQIEAFREENEELFQSGAGEILSYLIVKSNAFRTFIKHLNSILRCSIDCDRIAKLITGTTDSSLLFMSEMVHGPFDADKLDYMPRDGMFSGLKMHVDLDRLYHSVNIKSATSRNESQTRMCGHLSGLSPLTQIMFNKMLLFTGMYHHHKVRAVDCMLWAIFSIAHAEGATIGGQRITSPTDFLEITDDRMLVEELTDNDKIRKLIRAIRSRRLWKKAIVISRNTVPKEMHDSASSSDKPLYAGIATLAGNDRVKLDRRRELAIKIWEAAGKPCEEYEVWLDVPKMPKMTEAKMMWIDAPGQAEPRTLEHFIPVDKWVELYGTHQSRFHVFAPEEACEEIGKAAEVVFEAELGLRFLPEARAYAKVKA